MLHLYRGDDFQVLFAEIGDLRSLPNSVHSVSPNSYINSRGIKMFHKQSYSGRPSYIGLPPDRSNIKYAVRPVVPILHLCNQLNDGTFIATKYYAKNCIFL